MPSLHVTEHSYRLSSLALCKHEKDKDTEMPKSLVVFTFGTRDFTVPEGTKKCVVATKHGAVLVEEIEEVWTPIESTFFQEGIAPEVLARLEEVPLAEFYLVLITC